MNNNRQRENKSQSLSDNHQPPRVVWRDLLDLTEAQAKCWNHHRHCQKSPGRNYIFPPRSLGKATPAGQCERALADFFSVLSLSLCQPCSEAGPSYGLHCQSSRGIWTPTARREQLSLPAQSRQGRRPRGITASGKPCSHLLLLVSFLSQPHSQRTAQYCRKLKFQENPSFLARRTRKGRVGEHREMPKRKELGKDVF